MSSGRARSRLRAEERLAAQQPQVEIGRDIEVGHHGVVDRTLGNIGERAGGGGRPSSRQASETPSSVTSPETTRVSPAMASASAVCPLPTTPAMPTTSPRSDRQGQLLDRTMRVGSATWKA